MSEIRNSGIRAPGVGSRDPIGPVLIDKGYLNAEECSGRRAWKFCIYGGWAKILCFGESLTVS